jgi:Predicted integral membrane protein
MEKHRLESFSDAVLAIIITIMVLELGVPHGPDISALFPIVPVFLGYVLSFIYVGIYWNNHHHLLQTVTNVSGGILWANLFLLFWLSLFPFTTAWMTENHFAPWPTALYGAVLLMAAVAYPILQNQIIKTEGEHSKLKQAVGRDYKGKISIVCYFIAICVALILPIIAQVLYVIVALLWLIPDRRIERILD